VHLYTYDLFAEKMGFKLSWGCLVFYPFYYSIGVHSIVRVSSAVSPTALAPADQNDLSLPACALVLCVFFVGWIITRGANMQKYYFKTQPERTRVFGGLIEQRALTVHTKEGAQSTNRTTRILCSGFWGAARHFNYCGEIIQGIALALPGSLLTLAAYDTLTLHSHLDIASNSMLKVEATWLMGTLLLPWLYPLYYVLLFVSRQADDDAVCARKYGPEVWDAYVKAVPYRICPGVY
jgi:delta14-sterol reductase